MKYSIRKTATGFQVDFKDVSGKRHRKVLKGIPTEEDAKEIAESYITKINKDLYSKEVFQEDRFSEIKDVADITLDMVVEKIYKSKSRTKKEIKNLIEILLINNDLENQKEILNIKDTLKSLLLAENMKQPSLPEGHPFGEDLNRFDNLMPSNHSL